MTRDSPISSTRDAARLRYLRDCYREDHRSQAILDLFASKIERRQPLDAAAWASLTTGQSPPEEAPEHAFARQAQLYRAEKTPLVGRLLILGRVRVGEAEQAISAPLWLTPVEVVTADGASTTALRPVDERTYPNHAVLSLLAERHGVEPEALERFERTLPRPTADGGDDEEAAREIGRRFRELFDGVVIDSVPKDAVDSKPALSRLRRNVSRRTLGEAVARLTICRARMLLLVRQAVDTRGVSYELGDLADTADRDGDVLSPPVRTVFDGWVPPSIAWSIRKTGVEVPAILSAAQQRALGNAAREVLSLIIGPPGTGKSFTIAAVALDALSRGESVLIASKTDTAVDVVAEKLTELLGPSDAIVRGGRKGYARALNQSLLDLVHRSAVEEPRFRAERLRDQRQALDRQLDELAADLARRSRDEIRWGDLDAHLADGGGWRPVQRLQRWHVGRRIAGASAYWQLMERYRELLGERVQLQGEQLRDGMSRRLDDLLRGHRQTIVRLSKSIRATTVERRDRLWDGLDAEVLLHALPVWLVRLADISSVLPLDRNLFDLVILDEATQCDLASSVPVLQRGKRAVVVGDPKQLRHLSFLAGARQRRLGAHHGLDRETVEALDYRDQSVLDRVDSVLTSQDRVAHLDEHFRSVPSIIAFSNRAFYGDRLKVMQEHPAHDYRRALYLHRVDGRRDDAGVNHAEADALLESLRRQIAANRPHDAVPTIGVLSPFRAQVEHLGGLIDEHLDDRALARHDIRVGTPYAFQGAERDIMFLSFALDIEAHPSAFRYLERADVFNVAVTRARNRQEVFVSIDPSDPVLARSDLLRQFLEHMREDGLSPPPRTIDDPFLVAVRHRLELEGFRVWPAFAIAGLEVDLVIEREGACLGIDLVGHPGAFAGAFELERYRLFNRAGLRLLPLPWSAWQHDSGACVHAIRATVQEIVRRRRSIAGDILESP
ncbi:MAG: AAA domain-containing protein [Acidobacteriota bacterium]